MSIPEWLAEEFRRAEREWAELPEWVKPVYVPGPPWLTERYRCGVDKVCMMNIQCPHD